MVTSGSGSNWVVDIYDRSTDEWETIGDLSSAGDNWTLISLTLEGSYLPNYLDTDFDNEMLVRVHANTVGVEQVRIIQIRPWYLCQ